MVTRGRYIAFEGLDGSGKTSQAIFLGEWLHKQGLEVLQVREPCTPSGFPVNVRELLSTGCKLDRLSIEYLFQAARLEHLKVVETALSNGIDVISDRSYISGQVYAEAAGLDGQLVAKMSAAVPLKPDFLVYLDIDPEVAMQRLRDRGEELTRDETLEGMTRARQIYQEVLVRELFAGHMAHTVADGSKDKMRVAFAIRAAVEAFFEYPDN